MPISYLKSSFGKADVSALLARALIEALPLQGILEALAPTLVNWGNGQILSSQWSGSLSKGTAISNSSDIDLFISLRPDTTETLSAIHDTLFNALQSGHFSPRRQNVSIGATVYLPAGYMLPSTSYKVDLVPGKRWDMVSTDHSLRRSKASSWTKTNIERQVAHVKASRRLDEIMILKLWRHQQGLNLPSFLLELATIDACYGRRGGNLADNVWGALIYLRDKFQTAVLLDPANGSNRVSDDMSAQEKWAVAQTAARTLRARNWTEVVW